jgi:DNA-binding LacI/PurR family transcriptional regulator
LFLELSLKDKAPQVFADRLNEIVNSKPAGIIIAGGLNEIKWYEELIKPLKRENIGIIYRDNTKICSRFTRILTDDSLGWYLGTKHLLELGHRNILIMAASHHVHLPMREGCQLAFTEYDIDWNFEARLIPGRNSPETKKILYRYISSLKRPTAIFASSDCQAVMAYFVAMQLGLRIPEDLSLIGYYNTPWVEKIDIPLTSVFIKEQYIGQIIVEKMFGINSQFSRNTTTLIEPELIIRNSTSTLR